jgi:hypothetical protein
MTLPFKGILSKSSFSVLRNLVALTNNTPVILLLSPCRSGSTAIGSLLSVSGVSVFHQPIKSLLCSSIFEEKVTLPENLLLNRTSPIVIKETLGPYFQEECLFDPVALLLEAGLDKNQLQLVFLLRNPSLCLESWMKKFSGVMGLSDQVLEENFFSTTRNFCTLYNRYNGCS